MQKRKGLFVICIGIFLGSLLLERLGEVKASDIELTLAKAIYFVSFLPLLIYFWRSEKNIPYLATFGILYFIFFGLPIFNNYDLFMKEYLSPEVIIKCLKLVLGGFIFLMLAFYTPLGKIVNLINIPIIKMPWDYRKAYRIGIFLGLLGIGVQLFNVGKFAPVAFASLVSFIQTLSRLGIVVLFILQCQHKLKFRGKFFLWVVLFIPKVLLDLTQGASFLIILDFMMILFIYFYYYRSIPWLRIIVISLIFFVIFSVRDRYRSLVWFDGPYANANSLEKAVLYVRLIYERLSGEQEAHKEVYEKISQRTNSLVTFAKIVELTPQYIPYWEGYTYKTLVTSLIPRFILPDKPMKKLGQEFGHRYMLLHPEDTTTSYNLPMTIEMYINFGPLGVMLGMFILGLIFRIFYNLFNHPETGEGGLVIAVMIFLNLLDIESDFSLIFGAVLQYTLIFYIITKRMKPAIERPKS